MADIQVVLVEADQATRVQLRADIRAQAGIEVASEATNGETGLVLLESIDVDVAVVDANLPDMDLATFLQRLRDVQADSDVTQSKVLVLSAADSDRDPLLQAGADAVCPKAAPIAQLADAIRQVLQPV